MKKIKTIAIVVFILIIGISIFISTCCFFPVLNFGLDDKAWILAKDGTVIGIPNMGVLEFLKNRVVFQINNPNPNEKYLGRSLPAMITNHGMNKTQISYYTPPPPDRQEESYDSMDMMIDPSEDDMMAEDGMVDDTQSDSSLRPYDPYYCLESLDPLTNEVLARKNLVSEYDLSRNVSFCMCIPPHLIVFMNEEPNNQYRSYRYYEQSVKGDYNKTWTNLVFLENYSDDPMEWKKHTFDYYPPGDAHLLCWEYSPDYQGCFLLFENYPKECNELIYYHVAKQEVTAKVQIQGYREGFQLFSILNDKKHIMVYNENKIEFYSLPDLKLVKTVSHPDLKLETSPVVTSTDLRYIAYGRWKVYVLDTTSNEYFVLDKRHYNRIDMSLLYVLLYGNNVGNGFKVNHAVFMYDMSQLVFLEDKHILTGMTYNDQYYQWDVDARKRIVYKNLAVVPK